MAVQYTDLISKPVNGNTTVFNTKTGSAYSSPTQLATDLGVSDKAINWGNIKSDPNWSFSAPTQAASPTFSFMDKSTYDANQNRVTNSSSDVDTAVNNLGNDITKSSSKTPYLASSLESFRKSDEQNKDRQAQLEQRRKDELARLDAEYGTEKAKKEADYAETIKPYQERLQKLKDTPYGPNATLEEELNLKLQTLDKTHKLEMDTLFNRRQSSIALAQSAYEDKYFALAEAQIKNAKDAEKVMYERQQDYYNMVLKAQEEERARQKAEYEQAKNVFDFNMKYGIKEPYYTINGTVFNSQTMQPEFENVNGTMVRVSDGKKYGSSNEFFQDARINSFNQIQGVSAEQAAERDLVADMQKKYIDAGILLTDTYDQALQKVQNSSRIYRQQTRLADGSDENGDIPSDTKVKNLLYKIKSGSGKPWYDQWGEAAEYLKSENLNPNNYDKLFWEIFHPQGLKGYDEYVKNEGLD